MWKPFSDEQPDDVGVFQFCGSSDDGDASTWWLDARGGTHGIKWFRGKPDEADSPSADASCWLSFDPVGQDSLPRLEEHFVRGDELHLWYPQQQCRYALRLMLRPLAVETDRLVLEIVLAIETDLLDSHPMIDAVSLGSEIGVLENSGAGDRSSGSAPITTIAKEDGRLAILLGPHDSPFTTDLSGERASPLPGDQVGRDDQGCRDELRLRLFGEFLEKGVIRKARPWVILQAASGAWDASELRRFSQELHESPLPLTT